MDLDAGYVVRDSDVVDVSLVMIDDEQGLGSMDLRVVNKIRQRTALESLHDVGSRLLRRIIGVLRAPVLRLGLL